MEDSGPEVRGEVDEVKEVPYDSNEFYSLCNQTRAQRWNTSKSAVLQLVSVYMKQVAQRTALRPLLIETFIAALKLWLFVIIFVYLNSESGKVDIVSHLRWLQCASL
jgi:hypothetical protein